MATYPMARGFFKTFVVTRAGRVVRVEWADDCFRLAAMAPGERVEYVGTSPEAGNWRKVTHLFKAAS